MGDEKLLDPCYPSLLPLDMSAVLWLTEEKSTQNINLLKFSIHIYIQYMHIYIIYIILFKNLFLHKYLQLPSKAIRWEMGMVR